MQEITKECQKLKSRTFKENNNLQGIIVVKVMSSLDTQDYIYTNPRLKSVTIDTKFELNKH